MFNANKKYEELAKAKIQDKRNLVLSKAFVGGYTLAQQISFMEGPKETLIFLSGAFHIDNLEGVYNLRDALNEAIKKEEEKEN